MTWYSNVAHAAVEQVKRLARAVPDEVSGTRPSEFSSLNENLPTPSQGFFAPNLPLQAIPSRLDTSAIDRVYMAFDVSQPVDQPEDLRGRDIEVKKLLSGVLHRRNHGIVSGQRGSGKTSLVRVFGQYADRDGVVVLYSACDDDTTFGELIRSYLEQIPASMIDPDAIDLFGLRVGALGAESTPYQATSLLAMIRYSQLIIVLDEYDRVSDRDMHDKISSLLKLVSDSRLSVRLVLVGGRSVFADIVRAHPSLVRHITSVSTSPLSDVSIDELLDQCAQRCGVAFSTDGKALIQGIACGSPYHARLFGMHGAFNALAAQSPEITLSHVEEGLVESVREWALLNPVDADVFTAIVQGDHGEPNDLINLARYSARHEIEADQIVQSLATRLQLADPKGGGSDLRGSIRLVDGHVTFRDATAPQFLLALDHARKSVTQIKRGAQHA